MLDIIPNALDVSKGPAEWKRWKQNYEIYACANELEKKSSKVQIANFLYAIGEDAETSIIHLILNKNMTKTIKKVN